MKKLLILSALLVFAISLSYASNTAGNNMLMKRLVMNQRLLTGLSHTNYSIVTRKQHVKIQVIEHTFLNKLRLNARLITGFLNTTLPGTLMADYGSDPEYGETYHYDLNLDVDNDGMVHETDSLNIPSASWPTTLTLDNSQIHVYLSYTDDTYGDTNLTPYVEHWNPGSYTTTLSYDYPAADLSEKWIDYDWGTDEYQPARTVIIYYN